MDGHIHNIEHHSPILTKQELKKEKKSWLRIGSAFIFDMLPIIIGILIATGINEMKENNHRRELELISLKKIKKSIDDQINVLKEEIISFKELQTARNIILSAMDKPHINHDSLYPAINNFMVDIQPDIKNIGFYMLQNVGKLDVISDKEILDKLINLYQFTVPDLEKSAGLYISYKRNYLIPYMNENYSIAIRTTIKEHTSKIKKLINSLEYENIMMQIPLKTIISKYENTIREHEELSERIDKHLNSIS